MRQSATQNKYQSQNEPEQSRAIAMLVTPIPEVQRRKNQQDESG
jgi:hypothetical protein